MERSRAIVVCESNCPMLADGACFDLMHVHKVENMHFLHLDAHYGTVSSGGKRGRDAAPADTSGQMLPGAWTSARTKPIMMDELARAFAEGRLLRHARIVTYATPDREREEQLLYEADQDEATLFDTYGALLAADDAQRTAAESRLPAVSARQAAGLTLHGASSANGGPNRATLARLFAAEARVRLVGALAQQCKSMKRYTTHKKKVTVTGAVDTITSVTYSGKEKAASGRAESRDDLVMAMGIIIMGARAFYREFAFAEERIRVRVGNGAF